MIRRQRGGPGRVVAGAGAVGLVASFVLAVEKVLLLGDPGYAPSCDVGAVSCYSVMTSPQSSVLGFPNPFLGMLGFTVVTTLGVLVASGVRLPRWVWTGLLAGCLAGGAFIGWLIWQSLVVIGALCLYCMVVWVVVTVLLVHVPRALAGWGTGVGARAGDFLDRWHGYLLAAALLVLAILVVLAQAL
jgi:uncharacterized membrane protein